MLWKLSDPFFSLVAFSVYSGIMGFVLLVIPGIVLPLVGVHDPINSWTFMLGFVLICSSFYYFASGLAASRHFAGLTVYTRFSAPLVCVGLYLTGHAPINFVILSLVDASGGMWTLLALRRTKEI
ncbi:MAG: hypothetical protein JNM27_13815 [Leptospirales bacterium]|nr:hypothetical protein [Leptospirales bacterium]